jgi:hypothetical protein
MGRSSKFRQRIILADMPVRPVRQPSSRTLVLTSAMGPEMTPYPAPFSDAVRSIRPPGSCASPRVTRENSRCRPFQTANIPQTSRPVVPLPSPKWRRPNSRRCSAIEQADGSNLVGEAEPIVGRLAFTDLQQVFFGLGDAFEPRGAGQKL